MSEQRLNLGLQTKLTQKLLITPQMKQSLSLLQMPITELIQEISTYLEENPALENIDMDYDDSEAEENGGDENEEAGELSLLEDLSRPEWDDYISDSPNELSFVSASDEDVMNYEQYVSSEKTLAEHLLFQLKTSDLTDKQMEVGEEIIGNLSEDGYFRTDLSEIAVSCDISEMEAKTVLAVIQSFDPAGVASSTLAECILAQLEDLGASQEEYDQIKGLFEHYSAELANFKYGEIERESGLDKENLNKLLALIRRTDPHPGLNFSNRENHYILPDAFIVREGEKFEVLLNESGLPAIRLNSYYLKTLKDSSIDSGTREYMEEKIKNALWVLKSLQKRQKAIYKVTKAIVDIQKEYLLKGESYFKPLKLKDIAEITELHESTVSRVTSGKYVLTDKGLLELKSFFSKGVDSAEGDTSTRKVKMLIRSFVNGESAETPYSDERLVKLLTAEGIDIARRTVAKYRDEMSIPTMSQRKRIRR